MCADWAKHKVEPQNFSPSSWKLVSDLASKSLGGGEGQPEQVSWGKKSINEQTFASEKDGSGL